MNSPEKGWQPPPAGAGPIKEALAFMMERVGCKERCDHRCDCDFAADDCDAYAAARVAEAMKEHEAAVSEIIRAAKAVQDRHIAEARAQERRLYDEALDDAFFWLTSRNAKESDRVACADRIRRALAEPQEQT